MGRTEGGRCGKLGRSGASVRRWLGGKEARGRRARERSNNNSVIENPKLPMCSRVGFCVEIRGQGPGSRPYEFARATCCCSEPNPSPNLLHSLCPLLHKSLSVARFGLSPAHSSLTESLSSDTALPRRSPSAPVPPLGPLFSPAQPSPPLPSSIAGRRTPAGGSSLQAHARKLQVCPSPVSACHLPRVGPERESTVRWADSPPLPRALPQPLL